MKHHIIYIPGLGDYYNGFRRVLLSTWRLYGVTVKYMPMDWYQGGGYDQREARIKQAVIQAQQQGRTVSLVSESAGGSIALNVFSEDKSIYRLVSICGVNSSTTPISPRIYARSPAFQAAVEKLAVSLPTITDERRREVVVLTSLYDGTVKPSDSALRGARAHRIFAVGHIVAITVCLLFYGAWVTRFITRR